MHTKRVYSPTREVEAALGMLISVYIIIQVGRIM